MISSNFFSKQTILALSVGVQGALNLHATPFFILSVAHFQGIDYFSALILIIPIEKILPNNCLNT